MTYYDGPYNPPWKTGDTDMEDEVYHDLVPMDGYPKGSRGGTRVFNYRNQYWVVVGLTDFGDIFIGQWGPMAPQQSADDG